VTEKGRLIRILRELNLPRGQWILSGSGVMCLHGIERDRPMGDIDIFCSTRLWFDLYHSGLVGIIHEHGESPWRIFTTDPTDPKRCVDPPYLYKKIYDIEVNIFFSWRKRSVGDIDVGFWIANAQEVDGIPCIPIQFLLDWKEEVGRAKDATDIVAIRHYLEAKRD
jgi:hypothetical protein